MNDGKNSGLTSEAVAQRLSIVRKLGLGAFVVVSIFAAIVGVRAMNNAKLLMAEGIETQAIVTDLRVEQTTGRKGRVRDVYVVDYRFSDQNGASHTSQLKTGPDFYESLSVGGTYGIRYLPTNPDNHERVEVVRRQLSPVGLAIRALVAGLAVLALFEVARLIAGVSLRKQLAANR